MPANNVGANEGYLGGLTPGARRANLEVLRQLRQVKDVRATLFQLYDQSGNLKAELTNDPQDSINFNADTGLSFKPPTGASIHELSWGDDGFSSYGMAMYSTSSTGLTLPFSRYMQAASLTGASATMLAEASKSQSGYTYGYVQATQNNASIGVGTNGGGTNASISMSAASGVMSLAASLHVTTGAKVLFPDGSGGAPAMSFNNDTDTGFYRVSSNVLGFAVGGSTAAQLSATSLAVYPGLITFGQGANSVRAYVQGTNSGSGLSQFLDIGSADAGNPAFVRWPNAQLETFTTRNWPVTTAPASWRVILGGSNVLWIDNSPSMRKVKKRIAPLGDEWRHVLDLEPVQFVMKQTGDHRFGLIAEDTARVDPHFALWGEDLQYDDHGEIQRDDDGRFIKESDETVPTGIFWESITACLLAAVKELTARVDELEAAK